MSTIVTVVLAAVGAWLAASGGFVIGRWWQQRREQTWARDTQEQVSRMLDRIADKLIIEDQLAQAVDPLAHGGRIALGRVLAGLRDYGGYEAVVLADDAGLVIAACGAEEAAELIAIEAAAFGSAAEHIRGGRQAILHTQPEKLWTLHRYFRVDGALLSLSAARKGGTPRTEALDGALAAFQRVLAGADEKAA